MSKNIAESTNFISFTSKYKRQRFDRIALDTVLPPTFFEPLHYSAHTDVYALDIFSENNDVPSQGEHWSFICLKYCN